jgi:hypothetical protein
VSSPILIAEISLPQQRGRLLSLQQWMITWGVCDEFFALSDYSWLTLVSDPYYVFYIIRRILHEQPGVIPSPLGSPNDPRYYPHGLFAYDA